MNKKTKSPQPIEAEEMTDGQMKTYLIELYDSIAWQAIKRFNVLQITAIENSLCSLDAHTQSTAISRSQGMRIGILSLEQFIVEEKNRRESKEDGNNYDNIPVY